MPAGKKLYPELEPISYEENREQLEGPYKCPTCNGILMIDATFVDQVSSQINCPYCRSILVVPEI